MKQGFQTAPRFWGFPIPSHPCCQVSPEFSRSSSQFFTWSRTAARVKRGLSWNHTLGHIIIWFVGNHVRGKQSSACQVLCILLSQSCPSTIYADGRPGWPGSWERRALSSTKRTTLQEDTDFIGCWALFLSFAFGDVFSRNAWTCKIFNWLTRVVEEFLETGSVPEMDEVKIVYRSTSEH